MKKMMIALFVVLSIFAVVSCSSEVIVTEKVSVDLSTTKTTGTSSVTYKSSAKLYKALETGYTVVDTGSTLTVGTVGTVKVAYTTADSKLNLAFNYTAAEVADKSESVVLYYGVVENGLLSKDYAEITVKCTDKKPVEPEPTVTKVTLTAESQAAKADSQAVDVTTTGTSLKVYEVLTSGRESLLGTISTVASEIDFEELPIKNELTDATVATLDIKAKGTKTQLTGVEFKLDANQDAVGSAAEEFVILFKDANKTEVAKYTVVITVTPKTVSVNNVTKKIDVPAPKTAGSNYYFLYDESEEDWKPIASGYVTPDEDDPILYNTDDEYCGVLTHSYDANNEYLSFTTPTASLGTTPRDVVASSGKGVCIIGINDDNSTTVMDGSFVLSYENVDVSKTIEVVSSSEDSGYFEIEGGTKYTLYKRVLTNDSTKSKFVWSEWEEAGLSSPTYADKFYGVYSGTLTCVGNLDFTTKVSVFKCRFDGEDVTTGYKKTGYIQLAVVSDATNEVLATYQVEGTNNWKATN